MIVKGEKEQFLDWVNWGVEAAQSDSRLKQLRSIGRAYVSKTFLLLRLKL